MNRTFRSLLTTNPDLAKEWDFGKNRDITPDCVTSGSDKKVWWICEKGHSWLASVGSRSRGASCPYCCNQKVLVGYNDLESQNPILVGDWDYKKNGAFLPSMVTKNSNRKAWWLCKKGHSWEASISSRNKGSGCPYCSNQKILPGFNDLESQNPVLAAEWNYEKNGNLLPSMIAPKSNRKVWWKCKNGHEWENSPNKRTGNGCPFCSNQLLLTGFNDLATTNPEVLPEWDFAKNTEIDPKKIQAGSEKKAWWKCPRGHLYKMQIDLKVKKNHSCPICSKGRHVSFPEKAMAYYIQKVDGSIVESYCDLSLLISEIDIYSIKKKVGIEYDGKRWHNAKSLSRDIKKNTKCKEAGIILYRIRENGCPPIPDSESFDLYYDPNSISSLEEIIRKTIKKIYSIDCDVNINRDRIEIYKKIENWFDHNSASSLNQSVLSEWDYEKNMGLEPGNFLANTHKKVWWTCHQCGGSWQASIANRNNNRGCPYCTGHKLLKGLNDLATIAPDYLSEWDYEKNAINPSCITAHSAKEVWWKCKKGHSYLARVSNRVDLKRDCPICANKMIIPGTNDLATLCPELLVEWDFSKNEIEPTEISPKSSKKVWWKCSICGHNWLSSPNSRNGKKTNCPKCAENKKGETSKKQVLQLSKDGNIIRSFTSIRDAAKSVNRSPSAIVNACKGKTKTCGGYKWSYSLNNHNTNN